MGRSMDYLLHTMTVATNSSPDNGGGDDLLLLLAREGKFRAKTPATRENAREAKETERESKDTHKAATRKVTRMRRIFSNF